jgi:hypothetical protein
MRTRSSYEFIPKLKDKKVVIRLVSGGQPVIGTVEAYNPYELHDKTLCISFCYFFAVPEGLEHRSSGHRSSYVPLKILTQSIGFFSSL